MEEKFECELCLDNYNQFECKPFSLVPCGHSICSKCSNSLERNLCPYCRETFETKVPNWEIIKRLPKPVIPIIFNQLQIILNDTSVKYFNEYTSTTLESLVPLELINKLADKVKINKEDDKSNENVHKLLYFKMILTTYRNKAIDHANDYKLKRESFKKEIEKDENKYNENNLKKIKIDIDKLNSLLNDKKKTIKSLNQNLLNILNNTTATTNELIIHKLDLEINELNQKQITMFYHPNIVHSLENLANFIPRNTVAPSDPSLTNNSNNSASTFLTSSQKGIIFYILSKLNCFLVVFKN